MLLVTARFVERAGDNATDGIAKPACLPWRVGCCIVAAVRELDGRRLNMSDHEVVPVLPPVKERLIEFYVRNRIPFILEGPPGTGKSLAARYWVKRITGTDAVKIDITEDTELTHVLGDIDWKKLLAEASQGGANGGPADFTELYGRYYVPSAAVRAMEEGRVLLIEELDRCGRDTLFPVFFDMIEYRTTYVPALQREVRAAEGFSCIITVNRDTDTGTVRLPDALLRRCRRVFIPMPDPETEVRIVLANVPDAPERLVRRAVAAVQKLRRMEVEHVPVPSETVQWVMDVIGMFGPDAGGDAEQLEAAIAAVCKSSEDEQAFRSAIRTAEGVARGDAWGVRRG